MNNERTGMLILCATPIGNLEDMTLRALRVLKEADLIACEDTRTSAHLLAHYGIGTPLTSYHKFNEETKSEELIGKMLLGSTVALITDAGMPAISDPGQILVRKCHEAGVPVTAVPGACAAVTALALAGEDTRRFVFEGFLPQNNKEKKAALQRLEDESRTIVLYEAPHRLKRTLEALSDALGEKRPVVLVREITKKYEEIQRTTLGEACGSAAEPRGEYVLVIAGRSAEEIRQRQAEQWENMSISEHVALYERQGMDRKSAMKAAANDRGITKRAVYQELLESYSKNE